MTSEKRKAVAKTSTTEGMPTFHLDVMEAVKSPASLALAANKTLYLVFGDKTGLYLWRYDGTWSRERLDDKRCAGAEIALSDDESPRVIALVGATLSSGMFEGDEDTHLREYVRKAGKWSSEEIPNTRWDDDIPPWAFAAHGKHAALLIGGDKSTLFVHKNGWHEHGTWKSDHDEVALAVDAVGSVHVATSCKQLLEYRIFGPKGAVAPVGIGERYMTKHLSVAAGPNGAVAIGAMGSTASNDRAMIFTHARGAWTETTPDRKGNNGFDLALAFDRDGVLHGSWRTETSRASGASQIVKAMPVRYGCLRGKTWEVADVMIAGSPSTFALGSDGRIWIAAATYPRGAISVANNQQPTQAGAEQAVAPVGTPWMQLLDKLEKLIEQKRRARLQSPDGKKLFEVWVQGTTFFERSSTDGVPGPEVRKDYPKEKGALAKANSRAIDFLDKKWKLLE